MNFFISKFQNFNIITDVLSLDPLAIACSTKILLIAYASD